MLPLICPDLFARWLVLILMHLFDYLLRTVRVCQLAALQPLTQGRRAAATDAAALAATQCARQSDDLQSMSVQPYYSAVFRSASSQMLTQNYTLKPDVSAPGEPHQCVTWLRL